MLSTFMNKKIIVKSADAEKMSLINMDGIFTSHNSQTCKNFSS